MHQPPHNIKIVKLVNGEDVVTAIPAGDKQLPESHNLMRISNPLLIKYVPQMTMTGIKDYVALIKWCSYTSDQIITIPKDKIMTITNATVEMASSYMNVSNNIEEKNIIDNNCQMKKMKNLMKYLMKLVMTITIVSININNIYSWIPLFPAT